MDFPALKHLFSSLNEPTFRFSQTLQFYFQKYPKSWDDFTVLSKPLRETCAQKIPLKLYTVEKLETSKIDHSQKALLKFSDGESIETVYIPLKEDVDTVCVSCQSGCAMGCTFCATGQMGFKRNLTFPEIIAQITFWNEVLKEKNKKITRVVFMGMGEPLLNLDEVVKTIQFLKQKNTLGMSSSRFTISTCGIVPKLYELLEADIKGFNLAISLHAPTDELRNKLMPINKKYPLKELMKFCQDYTNAVREKIFFEYVMIDGVNNSETHATQLAKLLKPLYLAHVNLINYNPTSDQYQSSPFEKTLKFQDILKRNGLETFIRKSAGEDIKAACGQLKINTIKKSKDLNPKPVCPCLPCLPAGKILNNF